MVDHARPDLQCVDFVHAIPSAPTIDAFTEPAPDFHQVTADLERLNIHSEARKKMVLMIVRPWRQRDNLRDNLKGSTAV